MNVLKIIFVILVVIGVGIYGIQISRQPQVLAEQIEVPTPTIIIEFPTPTASPSATPTVSPTLRPTTIPTPSPTLGPTPTPTPIPNIVAPADLEPLFAEFGGQYGVNPNLLKKIADCESHYNSGVVSRNGLYAGMFQFAASTWLNQRRLMGQDPNPDLRFGARESIATAAFVISRQGPGAWPVCSK